MFFCKTFIALTGTFRNQWDARQNTYTLKKPPHFPSAPIGRFAFCKSEVQITILNQFSCKQPAFTRNTT